VVAEGVEELEQLDILTQMDCDSFQGHFFSRALPPGEVPGIVEALGRIRPDVQSSGR
jgi:EAL domain-containing protein (putative c-di-GMP-specific phosphodiesterase class I)